MSMRLALALVCVSASVAHAQSTPDEDRFFVDKVDDGKEDETLWQGSLTSTSFLHRETAGLSTIGAADVDNAGPARWFTDLRAQLDARHIGGGTWDFRFDGRARLVGDLANGNGGLGDPDPQSGSFSGNEYEIRDMYIVHGTQRTDLFVGRQTVLDLAGVKIDGARLDYAKNERWTYLGFAGLYPVRGSRSITTDYPQGVDAMGQPSKRVMPVAGGLGAAYRTQSTYGALGAVTIVPLADDIATGTLEEPRAFVTSNGYYRQSSSLDVFHYLVLDVVGAAGFAVTNGTLGVNWRPQPRLHVNANVNHIDTETLQVQAQTALEDPDTRDVGVVQNNVTVQRIASDNARVSVSAALGRTMRWEITAAGAVRQRPEITLQADEGGTDQIIPQARSGEIFFQAVDRHFYGDMRLALSFVRIFGLGENAAKSTSQIFRATANRDFADGKAEMEASLAYQGSVDENREVCAVTDINTCYGSSEVSTIAASGTAFYRLRRDWFAMGTLDLARIKLTTLEGGMAQANPAILSTTFFVRLAYRF
jgi:hypothetical protein